MDISYTAYQKIGKLDHSIFSIKRIMSIKAIQLKNNRAHRNKDVTSLYELNYNYKKRITPLYIYQVYTFFIYCNIYRMDYEIWY